LSQLRLCSYHFLLYTGDITYPPDQSQAPLGETSFTDGSHPLFSICLERAEDQDKKMADRWKTDADRILVRFSSVYCPFAPPTRNVYRLVCFLQQSRPFSVSPSKTSSQTRRISLRSISQISINFSPPILMGPASPSLPHCPLRPQFSPTRSAVWVNALWFLNLVMGFKERVSRMGEVFNILGASRTKMNAD